MRRIVFGALFIAFGLVLPSLFHLVGLGGPVFLPMHIPVLLGGLVLGPGTGLAVGVLTPVLSHILTGMPPISPPIMPLMVVELGVYGLVAGWLATRLRRGALLPLAGAMVAGRIALGLAAATAYSFFGFKASPLAYVTGAVVTGLPGLLVQAIAIPAMARLLTLLPSGILPTAARSEGVSG